MSRVGRYRWCPACHKMAEFPRRGLGRRGKVDWRCFECKLTGKVKGPKPVKGGIEK